MCKMEIIKNQKTLRCGITSGSCAAAAAKAAAEVLLLGKACEFINIDTPKGVKLKIPVSIAENDESYVRCFVVKDSGDDPDVTNGCKIYAEVSIIVGRIENTFFEVPNLFLIGGEGIGTVTKIGLEQKVGMSAINKVPRKMIFDAVKSVCDITDYMGNLLIKIEVPNGKELAERTFNSQLGIEGGISILGTSGILEPMSEKAIVDTIETQIKQIRAEGIKGLIVVPGNYGMTYANALGFDAGNAVKSSNYIGETLDFAVSYGIEKLLIVGNIGKLIKLAAGIMNTHSKTADARAEIMAVHAVLSGGTAETVAKIMKCVNTEEMLDLLDSLNIMEKTLESICIKIQEHLDYRVHNKVLCGAVLFSEKYGMIGKTPRADELCGYFRKVDKE